MVPEAAFHHEARHVAKVLRDVRFVSDPFAHIYTPSFFSDDFYAAIKAHMPPIATYGTYLDATGKAYGKFGFPLWFEEDSQRIDQLPPESRIFWERFVSHMLVSLYGSLIDKFSAFFALRFGEGTDVPLKLDARLSLDLTGLDGYVHTDNPDFVITFIVYLPDDNSLEDLGTGLYAPDDPGRRDMGNGTDPTPRFRKVRQIPFHPNTMVGFFKTAQSFHGVDAIVRNDVMRHSLIIHVKGRPEYFAELYGVDTFNEVFSNRTVQDFAPVSDSLRRCEQVLERGVIDDRGNLLAPVGQF